MTRRSEIANVELKTGGTGALCFVTVNHTYSTPRGVAIKEVQNIVYRDPPPADGKARAASRARAEGAAFEGDERRPGDAVPLLGADLQRPSHPLRPPYVTGVEGYPGLIVHGPLQAALLIEYAIELRGGKPPKRFMHRGVNPLFDGDFAVNAQPTADGFELWTTNPAGAACMKAGATW